ncbi:MAG: RagB/SusD family nutrient uptake outer membrane protein [Candidatus Symbiothrix sp.]|jgi:hypothetical protein|nr:RagB/SusD family nutrient uptake outer membrane protein [Candidatus Symbiothrix sp.]
MKKIIYILTAILSFVPFHSCDYLDVVPDDIATLDHSFANRLEAEKFLFTCYSYIPETANVNANIGLCGADEIWTNRYRENDGLRVAKGQQNINDPFINYWEGKHGTGINLYNAIRDCNIFLEILEDASRVPDLSLTMRRRWICEVKFLKAYYHFYLFKMYGPIVIADKNIPIDATTEEVRVKRATVDEVVHYISDLYDESLGDPNRTDLPEKITNPQLEMGRITRDVVLSMKARLWVYAASPLFNPKQGDTDYQNFKDKDNVFLFPQSYDPDKWIKAKEACEAALTAAEIAGVRPYTFITEKSLPEETMTEMRIRNSFADDEWSSELIWGLTGSGRRGNDNLQARAMARINPAAALNNAVANDELNPTIQITKFYYTKNGVPVSEDKTWLSGRSETDIVTIKPDYKNNLVEGYDIAAMHVEREPRFYANLAFDGSIWYMENSTAPTMWSVKCRIGGQQAKLGTDWFSLTGYWPKKLVNWKYVINQEYGSRVLRDYPWPEMRLCDLYLLYAETLCETGDLGKAIEYIDKVREKAGLQGIVESWTNYSNQPNKFNTQGGLRDIIKQERTIEFMFEGHRYWDVRRWKDLHKLNQIIQGWDVEQETPDAYYRPKNIFIQGFVTPRDYFSPLSEQALIVNPNLVQNPGW